MSLLCPCRHSTPPLFLLSLPKNPIFFQTKTIVLLQSQMEKLGSLRPSNCSSPRFCSLKISFFFSPFQATLLTVSPFSNNLQPSLSSGYSPFSLFFMTSLSIFFLMKIIFIYAAIAFLVEYSVIGLGITGLATVVYELLVQLTLLCAGSCLVLSVKPTAFFAEILLSNGLVFKGTWLFQAGLCLYTDAFVLKGCKKMVVLPGSPNADVHCELEEDGMRGVALVNLLFVVNAIGIVIDSFVVFGLLSNFRNLRCGAATGPLLAKFQSETILMRPSHELEKE